MNTIRANIVTAAFSFQAADADARDRVDNANPFVAPVFGLSAALSTVENEITATPAGREYADVVRRHLPEAMSLVNHNRRVATVWHRRGGPALFNAVLRTLRFDDEPLPRESDGQPIAECVATLEKVFRRYASRQFARDLARISAALVECSGMTYPQVLTALRAGPVE